MKGRLAVVTVWSIVGLIAAADDSVWLAELEYDDLHIVVAPAASAPELEAAERFQEYWTRCTGYLPSLGSAPVRDAVNVWVSRENNPFCKHLALDALAPGEFLIQTLDFSWRKTIRDHFGIEKSLHYQRRKHLVLAGGTAEGTLEAVEAFFARYVCPEKQSSPTTCADPGPVPWIHDHYKPAGPPRTVEIEILVEPLDR